jgi:23S rRNA pseudouridine1911/1915/1917 synthase
MLSQGDHTGDACMVTVLKQYLSDQYNKANPYLGAVHRLDRNASGLLIFTKTSKAAARLSKSFRQQDVHKQYLAVAQGAMPIGSRGRLVNWLSAPKSKGKARVKRQIVLDAPEYASARIFRKIKITKKGDLRLACTNFEVIVADPVRNMTLLSVLIESGRKHQIRAQLSHYGKGKQLWHAKVPMCKTLLLA